MIAKIYKRKQFSVTRLTKAVRVQEVLFTDSGPVILYINKEGPAFFAIRHVDGSIQSLSPDKGIPYDLKMNGHKVTWKTANSPRELQELFQLDLARNHASGVMNLGDNNLEGRVPWSQVYFLNGLLDTLYLSSRDAMAFEIFSPLIADIKLRLDIEMFMLAKLQDSPISLTNVNFTPTRKPATFAVQTSRILLLWNRYTTETAAPLSLAGLEGICPRHGLFERASGSPFKQWRTT